MLKICVVFSESEPQYAYKLYAYKKKHVVGFHVCVCVCVLEKLCESTQRFRICGNKM